MSSASEKKTTKLIKKGVLYSAPFLLFAAAVVFFSVWAFQAFVSSSSYFQVIVDENDVPSKNTPIIPTKTAGQNVPDPAETQAYTEVETVPATETEELTQTEEDKPREPYDPSKEKAPATADVFPVISWGDKWGTIKFFGWKRRGIPLYSGNDTDLLKKGACMNFRSAYCGQGGRTIISAHVNSYFNELEDVEIGDMFYIDTIYGRYVYRVTDIFIFNYDDSKILFGAHKGEKNIVFLYTCYPRRHPYEFKDKRLGVIAEMVEGKDWSVKES
ncbi:MAG: class D sortase [Clostridia bacterium]|nr:class D sortase [Clostridia bacterium]